MFNDKVTEFGCTIPRDEYFNKPNEIYARRLFIKEIVPSQLLYARKESLPYLTSIINYISFEYYITLEHHSCYCNFTSLAS